MGSQFKPEVILQVLRVFSKVALLSNASGLMTKQLIEDGSWVVQMDHTESYGQLLCFVGKPDGLKFPQMHASLETHNIVG